MKRTALRLGLGLVGCLAFAGCGGDDDSGAGGAGASAGTASGGSAGATGGSGGAGTGGSGGATGGSGGATGGSGGATGGSGGATGGSAGATGGSGGATGGSGGATGGSAGTGGGAAGGLAASYPGDVGIESDPDVVWAENFEEGSASAVLARYDDSKQNGFSLDSDVPPESSGSASGQLTASGAGPNAVDFYKNLAPGYDELFVRYYVKYEANVPWHHTGVWVGGYNPPSNWPNPQAGLQPNGDDRFSVSIEPLEQNSAAPRLDFYNYWMKMHSWMDQPAGSTAYYGNSLIHDPSFTANAQWQCIEIHIKLNPDPSTGAGAELGVWLDDQSVIQFTDTSPVGYWVKDKFCPDAATGTECTNYRPANPTLTPLDLQFRNTTDLKINAFWPQNYITNAGSGSVWYDDMVVATRRIGCIR